MADSRQVIISQYHASLEMLWRAITRCPDALWDHPGDRYPFWQTVYHTLFYTHLYLQPDKGAFVPWHQHRQGYHDLGSSAVYADGAEPYSKEELLDYYAFCWQEVTKQAHALELDTPSGFHWLPFGKLELQLYNIRHIQHHTGALYERLGSSGEREIGWVASVPA